ncbi:cancer-related nucleoside-triphosphatase homolog [Ischnura elegans]|uniref:cancer-related nucleoside-triphosphatase homolog n=1 Tax=Ischnura elegans TaxID=197161 RepID=UPI001ED8B0BC|nr:cancer-related nucleoside-triphosphatase homolog [Ischnura elegans]
MSSSPYNIRKILLTGPPGVGKTTLVQKACSVLKEKGLPTSGFFTEEIREGRQRVGFNVVTVDGKTGPLARLSTNCDPRTLERMPRVGQYAVDKESFESLALPSLKAQSCTVIILDEIGKMEMFSESFKQEVLKVFAGPNVVLATIPMPKGKPIPFIESLKKRPDVKIITVTRENRNSLENEVTLPLLTMNKQR